MKPTFIALLALCLCLPLAGADKEKPLPKDIKSLVALAEKGDARAQIELGTRHAFPGLFPFPTKSEYVPLDFKEAVKWFRKVAEQGYTKAQLKLGLMYYVGGGVMRDHAAAYAWITLAAVNGDKRAEEWKGIFFEEFTPEQITKAEELVKEMIKKNPKLLK